MAPDHPDERHEDEVRDDAARAENERRAQAHDVAEAEDESDRVELHDDLCLLSGVLHDREELEVDVLLPDVERRHEEVVDPRDERRLQEQLRLRAALLARHKDLRDRGRFREREFPVHLAHEVAAERDHEEDPEAPTREADENRLRRVRVELERIERGKSEDRAGDDSAGDTADRRDDHVLEEMRAARVDAREADRENRDRDRGLHDLPDLEAGVRRGHREDDAEEEAPRDGAPRGLGRRLRGRHDRGVRLARLQRLVRVLGQRLRVGCVHLSSGFTGSCQTLPVWRRGRLLLRSDEARESWIRQFSPSSLFRSERSREIAASRSSSAATRDASVSGAEGNRAPSTSPATRCVQRVSF